MFAELSGYDAMEVALETEGAWRQARVEVTRQWRLRNPERARANARRSSRLQRARGESWAQRNPEAAKAANRARYARTKNERREMLRAGWRERKRRSRQK